MSKAKFKI